eukprot:3986639-Pleurochrysis_carterae.AAC.1
MQKDAACSNQHRQSEIHLPLGVHFLATARSRDKPVLLCSLLRCRAEPPRRANRKPSVTSQSTSKYPYYYIVCMASGGFQSRAARYAAIYAGRVIYRNIAVYRTTMTSLLPAVQQ